ncbi:unnamed protein product [Spirodela intermedia]|uniref:Uncharacterized protein n=1 Tax=Spirodela intermedia TaxID=51605 RepID=A0A7I8JQI8_SPIIN|nr:unnamed protein product [Spirodela intermedia]CAA6672031.1 unnamed protein product [Spirodela intermedia]
MSSRYRRPSSAMPAWVHAFITPRNMIPCTGGSSSGWRQRSGWWRWSRRTRGTTCCYRTCAPWRGGQRRWRRRGGDGPAGSEEGGGDGGRGHGDGERGGLRRRRRRHLYRG